jgi:hypothetical protein
MRRRHLVEGEAGPQPARNGQRNRASSSPASDCNATDGVMRGGYSFASRRVLAALDDVTHVQLARDRTAGRCAGGGRQRALGRHRGVDDRERQAATPPGDHGDRIDAQQLAQGTDRGQESPRHRAGAGGTASHRPAAGLQAPDRL